MSCWVVPSVAADFWGVSVQSILDRIKDGQILSKRESGFTFVDVAPQSPTFEKSKSIPRPTTYTVVTPAEIEALAGPIQDDWRMARSGATRLRKAPARA
jgi:hypothetical protein